MADTLAAYEVTRLWRASGKYHGADVTSPAGGRFTAYFARGQVMWAEPDVWAFPERHGLVRYYCPGHGGAVCQYGACDEIRVADLAQLKASAFKEAEK